MEYRICKICGKTFVPFSDAHVICSDECRAEAKRQYQKEFQQKQKIKHLMEVKPKICVICGAEFKPRNSLQVTCSPVCQKERDKSLQKSYTRAKAEKRKEEKRKKPESLAEVQRKARAAGLSYGQYVLLSRAEI